MPALSLPLILLAVVSYFLPLVSSLLAKQHWPVEVLGLLTTLLAAVAGFVTEWAHADAAFDWRKAAAAALGSWLVAAVARRQTWAGSRIDAKLLAAGHTPEHAA